MHVITQHECRYLALIEKPGKRIIDTRKPRTGRAHYWKKSQVFINWHGGDIQWMNLTKIVNKGQFLELV